MELREKTIMVSQMRGIEDLKKGSDYCNGTEGFGYGETYQGERTGLPDF